MKRTTIRALILSLTLVPHALTAEESRTDVPETSTTTVTSEAPVAAPSHSKEILSALKHLSVLLSKGSLVDRTRLDALAKEISELDGKVRELLGPVLLDQLKKEEAELLRSASISAAKTELARTRVALMSYYMKSEGGTYPPTPEALAPEYLPAMPELRLPWHTATSSVTLTGAAGPDAESAVTDTGGWLYFTDPKASNFGMLLINCSHKDDQGLELYKY